MTNEERKRTQKLIDEARTVISYWKVHHATIPHETGPLREQLGAWIGRLDAAVQHLAALGVK